VPFGSDEWEGREGLAQGDVVGLLLDCDTGTLAVEKNGPRLGAARSPPPGWPETPPPGDRAGRRVLLAGGDGRRK
jgi:hypothetical protein